MIEQINKAFGAVFKKHDKNRYLCLGYYPGFNLIIGAMNVNGDYAYWLKAGDDGTMIAYRRSSAGLDDLYRLMREDVYDLKTVGCWANSVDPSTKEQMNIRLSHRLSFIVDKKRAAVIDNNDFGIVMDFTTNNQEDSITMFNKFIKAIGML